MAGAAARERQRTARGIQRGRLDPEAWDIGNILGLYWDNGKENGNYCNI